MRHVLARVLAWLRSLISADPMYDRVDRELDGRL